MKTLADFMSMVMPYCPTAPEPVVMQNLRLSAREFCKETRCWRQIVTTEIAENPVYPVLQCSGTIVAVQSAKLNGRDLKAVPFDDVDISEYMTKTGRAETITQDESGDRLIIGPFEAGTLVTSLYLAPSAGVQYLVGDSTKEPQNQVPDFLFNEHAEAIAHGALYRILSLPKQEYSDGGLAGYFKSSFDIAKKELKSQVIKGKQRAPIRTKSRWM